jgi:nucleoside-diphosphate-sugar epimerase
MRLVITGANGFIGSRLLRLALHRGHQVVAPLRDEADLRRIADLEGRYTRTGSRPMDLRGTDALVHLAWPVPPRTYRHDRANLDGLDHAARLFAAAARARIPSVVGVGTCLELGATEAVRCESDPAAPEDLYATAKDAAARLGSRMVGEAGGTFTWARLFHVVGPGEARGRLVREALEAFRAGRAFRTSPGMQVRDWLHVDDVAAALLTLAEAAPGGPVHVCGGRVAPLATHLRHLATLAGTRDLLRIGGRPYGTEEHMSITGHPETLLGLGWRPCLRPQEALAHAIDAFRAGCWDRAPLARAVATPGASPAWLTLGRPSAPLKEEVALAQAA